MNILHFYNTKHVHLQTKPCIPLSLNCDGYSNVFCTYGLMITFIHILLEELINEAACGVAVVVHSGIIYYTRDDNKLLLYANKLCYKGFRDCLFKLRIGFYLLTC